jgi:hypothetical protein
MYVVGERKKYLCLCAYREKKQVSLCEVVKEAKALCFYLLFFYQQVLVVIETWTVNESSND